MITENVTYFDIFGVKPKGPYEAKFQLLIKKRESAGLKYWNDSKGFVEYSDDMDDIYKNIEEYSLNKKRKILIVFDDVIADMLSNKKPNPIVDELCNILWYFWS